MLDWCGWLWLGAVALLAGYEWCARRVPPPWWYFSQRKRTVMRVALQTVADAGQPIYWQRSRVVQADREKCFVLVQNRIRLLLNPNEDDHIKLYQTIDVAFKRVRDEGPSDKESEADVETIIRLSQAILKREWQRVKAGL